MAIELHLCAAFPQVELVEIEKWILEYCNRLQPKTLLEKSQLLCKLHPASDYVKLWFDAQNLNVSATTSLSGPGYHIYLCDMLHALAKAFAASWPAMDLANWDDTKYFHSGDQAGVYEAMLLWLQNNCKIIERDPYKYSQLGMEPWVNYLYPARLLTATGPRDVEWVARTAKDGENGRDFFAWWKPELDAEYYLGRALVQMWEQVRWRKPITDDESDIFYRVISSLAQAWVLNSELNYPWAEWSEMLGYAEISAPEFEVVHERARGMQSTIGYRRYPVKESLPEDWVITFPGSFSEFKWSAGHFVAQNTDINILFRPEKYPEHGFAEEATKIRNMQSDQLIEEAGYIAQYNNLLQKNAQGVEYFSLVSLHLSNDKYASCGIIYNRAEQLDEAIAIWKSLRPENLAASAKTVEAAKPSNVIFLKPSTYSKKLKGILTPEQYELFSVDARKSIVENVEAFKSLMLFGVAIEKITTWDLSELEAWLKNIENITVLNLKAGIDPQTIVDLPAEIRMHVVEQAWGINRLLTQGGVSFSQLMNLGDEIKKPLLKNAHWVGNLVINAAIPINLLLSLDADLLKNILEHAWGISKLVTQGNVSLNGLLSLAPDLRKAVIKGSSGISNIIIEGKFPFHELMALEDELKMQIFNHAWAISRLVTKYGIPFPTLLNLDPDFRKLIFARAWEIEKLFENGALQPHELVQLDVVRLEILLSP